MRLVIDRFEGDYAVCEDENRQISNIERRKLPSSVKEGDVLKVDGDNIEINARETKERERKIKKIMDDLWE